jgi:hypothetical protein
VTRQQRMGEQSRLSTWPDVNVLIATCTFCSKLTIPPNTWHCSRWRERRLNLWSADYEAYVVFIRPRRVIPGLLPAEGRRDSVVMRLVWCREKAWRVLLEQQPRRSAANHITVYVPPLPQWGTGWHNLLIGWGEMLLLLCATWGSLFF